jgi:hypothetical protein
MKARRYLRTHRLSIWMAVTVALTAIGLTAFVASAGAEFTLSTGALKLTNGTTGTPLQGSWVELLNKETGAPFENGASEAANKDYSLILGTGAVGLLLGTSQPTGGIFGPLTYFGLRIPSDLFSLDNLARSQLAFLLFSGTDSETGTRALLGGNLLGLQILYAGASYKVGTLFGSGPDIVKGLTGTITGNALSTRDPATILLHWETALLENGFEAFNALFHLEGQYN